MQRIDKSTKPGNLIRKDSFTSFFDYLDDAVVVCNQYALISYVNKTTLKLFGKTRSMVQYESLSVLLPLFNFETFDQFIKDKTKDEYSCVHHPVLVNGTDYLLEVNIKKTDKVLNDQNNILVIIRKIYESSPFDFYVSTNRFEEIVSEVSGLFASSYFRNINNTINRSLDLLGTSLQTDYCHLYLLTENQQNLKMTHEWVAKGLDKFIRRSVPVRIDFTISFWDNLIHKQSYYIDNNHKRTESETIKEILQLGFDIKSIVCVPIFIQEKLSGVICCSTNTEKHAWPVSYSNLLRVTGEIMISTLERENYNKSTQDKEKQLHTFFSNAVLGLYRTTPAGKILMINDALIKMLGYKQYDEISGINIANEGFYDGFERQKFKYQMNRNGEVTNFRSVWKKKNGDPLFVVENAKAVKDVFGKTVYYEGTIEDITDKTLQEEESFRLTQVIRQAAMSILITNINGKIKYANPYVEKITGYYQSEILGKTPALFGSGKQNKAFYTNLWNTIMSGKVWQGTFSNKKKSGELFDESAIVFPIYNKVGKLINFAAIKQDISEHIQNLKIQNLLFRISNAVHETKDLSEFYVQVRRELSKILNTRNFFIAIYDKKSKTFHLPYIADEKDEIKHVPAGKSLSSYVMKHDRAVILKQPELFDLIRQNKIELVGSLAKVWLGVPLRSNGKPIGVIGLQSYDNDSAYSEKDLKLLEFVSDQIRLSIERKESEVKLIKAKKKAEQSDKLKSAFLANMSHEIRTPMNAIIGFSGLLASDEFSAEDKMHYNSQVQENANTLLNLIEDIIDISKIEAGETNIKKETFSVKKTLNELFAVHEMVKQKAGKYNIDLRLNIPRKAENDILYSDQRRLRQIVSNLLSNAIKYTHNGHIEFGYSRQPGEIQFYVRDTGIGIPDNKKSYIFDSFTKFSETKTKVYGGTGIGLAISKNLVKILGGEIWVNSKENRGSTFYFTIPVSEGQNLEDDDIPENYEISNINWHTKKILVAEDVESNYVYLESLLKPTGVLTIWAKDGKQAVDFISENPDIDLILMDIRMPVMNGFEATKRLRNQGCKIPIIAQTAHALESDKHDSLNAGCEDYIAKPLKSTNLIYKIKKQLDKQETG